MNPRDLVALLLALSAINLALMIPGGFVETRDFSAYPAIVLAGFNIFLTVLGLGSLVLAWLTWRGGVRRGWSMAAAIGFALVYLLDLFAIPGHAGAHVAAARNARMAGHRAGGAARCCGAGGW